ncbi:MAG: tRNA (N6-isopentenyl adenosine(37)-C2)-methylthiotransferase MiaB [Pseudomonadota bacterium]
MEEDKKVYIKTYGCQMNVYDSERMAANLAAQGYAEVASPEDADVILLNTCHIREKAAEKVYSELGRLKPLKADKPDLRFGVVGCVAQAEGAEIIARQPMVDLVVGPQSYHNLPRMLERVAEGGKSIDTDFPIEDKFEKLADHTGRKVTPTAFVTVQEGCDKFCAFCVVPYTRGAEVSRPVAQVLAETKALVSKGVREVTLLGQNVNAYHGEADSGTWGLARLIRELAEIDGLDRIRFTTSHPNDMDEDLIRAHGEIEKLMPYLHLPVQSGSDKILKRMARKHTRDDYFRIIDQMREARPDLALSGDFIVGFPEESDQDFEDTMDLVRRVEYAQAYSFKYSERPGTPAVDRAQVPEDVKGARLMELQALLTEQQKAFQQGLVGKTLDVLFEKDGREDGQLTGRSEYLLPVHAMAPQEMKGQIAPVKIDVNHRNSLGGKLASETLVGKLK